MTGYRAFSDLLGRFPQLHCYRRFGSLSAKVLLYRQAELSHLEAELRVIVAEDEGDPTTCGCDRSWQKLNEFAAAGASGQRDKVVEIDGKLREYHDSLIRVAQVCGLGMPHSNSVVFLRKWLQSPEHGAEFLESYEGDPWEPECERDLLALYDEGPGDGLARCLSKLGKFWHHVFGHRLKPETDMEAGLGRVWEYRHRAFARSGDALCVFVSFMLPSMSTFVLFYVNDMVYRLGLMTCFLFVLAVLMMFALECRRVEVFAATATFAAVQVVFLQGVNMAGDGT
ncbi:uncharacterized protein A1O9_12284 [Exophiala aquamarina CBS 119918]|uniref:DUF6594 domain-containing protein n=1 Tax=Exophiala aquamarina CBS 119918 TaxID=1182545 RepID=A0A072NUU4_9EURO|nr:uncharacterized protein A1O9_12284 [Exophiala aquamarina CBS 119918]KEF51649.1 hypothetical protein A1O9_12284 [Exophiala aquamarina CBS 119918]